jgi:hypothetical protein
MDRKFDPSTVEITGHWKKGSRSNTLQNVGCVEVAPNNIGGLSFRDSKLGDAGPVHHFNSDEIFAFFTAVKDGEFGEFSPTV